MNRELIKEYFEVSLKNHLAVEGSPEEEATYDRLDAIWKDYREDDRRMTNLLLIDHPTGSIEERLHNINKTLQEKTIMLNILENKEDYLKLRDFWKTLHAEGKHKATRREYTTGIYDTATKSWLKGYHMESDLEFRQHLIYLAAVGRDLSKATTNMHLETIENMLSSLRYCSVNPQGNTWFFGYFEGIIDPKYRPAIINRILKHFEMELVSFKNR